MIPDTMLTLLIIGISFTGCTAVLLFYYNYIAHFHRIHLFGEPRRKKIEPGILPVFTLPDLFIGKEDLSILGLLKKRKLPVVVCLGDSITHGIVSTNYVMQLQEKFNSRFLFVNSGVNGNLAYNLKVRLQEDCIDFDPDFVTILIGTNDVNSHKDEKTLTRYLRFHPRQDDGTIQKAGVFAQRLSDAAPELRPCRRASWTLSDLR